MRPLRTPRGLRSEGGFLTIQFLLAVAFSLVVFTMLANLVLVQYGRGVVRAALDEGVRAGSRVSAAPSVQVCEERVAEALSGLLRGSFGNGIAYGCAASATEVTATADASFDSFAPMVPDFSFALAATAVRERAP